MNVRCTLTVLFEEPFWVGLAERYDEHGYSVARVVFGGEPSEVELYRFILDNYAAFQFSEPLPEERPEPVRTNFKRKQREARRLAGESGPSTKSQEALRLELEKNKKVRQQVSKAEREALAEQKFHLHQQRKKEKKRGH